jgi:hypothetical protein
MAPERGGEESREPDEIDEVVDEFGDRAGPDPAREPELELADDEDVIVEPAGDDD